MLKTSIRDFISERNGKARVVSFVRKFFFELAGEMMEYGCYYIAAFVLFFLYSKEEKWLFRTYATIQIWFDNYLCDDEKILDYTVGQFFIRLFPSVVMPNLDLAYEDLLKGADTFKDFCEKSRFPEEYLKNAIDKEWETEVDKEIYSHLNRRITQVDMEELAEGTKNYPQDFIEELISEMTEEEKREYLKDPDIAGIPQKSQSNNEKQKGGNNDERRKTHL